VIEKVWDWMKDGFYIGKSGRDWAVWMGCGPPKCQNTFPPLYSNVCRKKKSVSFMSLSMKIQHITLMFIVLLSENWHLIHKANLLILQSVFYFTAEKGKLATILLKDSIKRFLLYFCGDSYMWYLCIGIVQHNDQWVTMRCNHHNISLNSQTYYEFQ
jgi:hypothetical protein